MAADSTNRGCWSTVLVIGISRSDKILVAVPEIRRGTLCNGNNKSRADDQALTITQRGVIVPDSCVPCCYCGPILSVTKITGPIFAQDFALSPDGRKSSLVYLVKPHFLGRPGW